MFGEDGVLCWQVLQGEKGFFPVIATLRMCATVSNKKFKNHMPRNKSDRQDFYEEAIKHC